MQPKFVIPDFMKNSSAGEIHQRMMNNLPADIDDMPGGFPYDFTMPAALEIEEFINYHLMRALMICFPQYAWDEWLDIHGQQVHLKRHPPEGASGKVNVTGKPKTVIEKGTVFCTPATDTGPSIGFSSIEAVEIDENGTAIIPVLAVEKGTRSNVPANVITLMAKPDKNITGIINLEPIQGGMERESNDDYYDRIAEEYAHSLTYLGNDSDYIRWAKEAGAGDCIVIQAAEGPGTVKLVLVDRNGQPANEELVQKVYDYIVSPVDRSRRILPTACAKLICVSATTVLIDYTISGLIYDETTSLEQIKEDFTALVKTVYESESTKQQDILRYNDVRPVISDIAGVIDFGEFRMNGDTGNIRLNREEYPETGTLDFS